MSEPMSGERLAQLTEAAGRRHFKCTVADPLDPMNSPCDPEHCAACAIDELLVEAKRARAALETLRGQFGEPRVEWGHQAIRPDGSLGDVVVNDSEESTRWAMAHMQDNFPGTWFVLKNREVWSTEGPWRVAEEGGEPT